MQGLRSSSSVSLGDISLNGGDVNLLSVSDALSPKVVQNKAGKVPETEAESPNKVKAGKSTLPSISRNSHRRVRVRAAKLGECLDKNRTGDAIKDEKKVRQIITENFNEVELAKFIEQLSQDGKVKKHKYIQQCLNYCAWYLQDQQKPVSVSEGGTEDSYQADPQPKEDKNYAQSMFLLQAMAQESTCSNAGYLCEGKYGYNQGSPRLKIQLNQEQFNKLKTLEPVTKKLEKMEFDDKAACKGFFKEEIDLEALEKFAMTGLEEAEVQEKFNEKINEALGKMESFQLVQNDDFNKAQKDCLSKIFAKMGAVNAEGMNGAADIMAAATDSMTAAAADAEGAAAAAMGKAAVAMGKAADAMDVAAAAEGDAAAAKAADAATAMDVAANAMDKLADAMDKLADAMGDAAAAGGDVDAAAMRGRDAMQDATAQMGHAAVAMGADAAEVAAADAMGKAAAAMAATAAFKNSTEVLRVVSGSQYNDHYEDKSFLKMAIMNRITNLKDDPEDSTTTEAELAMLTTDLEYLSGLVEEAPESFKEKYVVESMDLYLDLVKKRNQSLDASNGKLAAAAAAAAAADAANSAAAAADLDKAISGLGITEDNDQEKVKERINAVFVALDKARVSGGEGAAGSIKENLAEEKEKAEFKHKFAEALGQNKFSEVFVSFVEAQDAAVDGDGEAAAVDGGGEAANGEAIMQTLIAALGAADGAADEAAIKKTLIAAIKKTLSTAIGAADGVGEAANGVGEAANGAAIKQTLIKVFQAAVEADKAVAEAAVEADEAVAEAAVEGDEAADEAAVQEIEAINEVLMDILTAAVETGDPVDGEIDKDKVSQELDLLVKRTTNELKTVSTALEVATELESEADGVDSITPYKKAAAKSILKGHLATEEKAEHLERDKAQWEKDCAVIKAARKRKSELKQDTFKKVTKDTLWKRDANAGDIQSRFKDFNPRSEDDMKFLGEQFVGASKKAIAEFVTVNDGEAITEKYQRVIHEMRLAKLKSDNEADKQAAFEGMDRQALNALSKKIDNGDFDGVLQLDKKRTAKEEIAKAKNNFLSKAGFLDGFTSEERAIEKKILRETKQRKASLSPKRRDWAVATKDANQIFKKVQHLDPDNDHDMENLKRIFNGATEGKIRAFVKSTDHDKSQEFNAIILDIRVANCCQDKHNPFEGMDIEALKNLSLSIDNGDFNDIESIDTGKVKRAIAEAKGKLFKKEFGTEVKKAWNVEIGEGQWGTQGRRKKDGAEIHSKLNLFFSANNDEELNWLGHNIFVGADNATIRAFLEANNDPAKKNTFRKLAYERIKRKAAINVKKLDLYYLDRLDSEDPVPVRIDRSQLTAAKFKKLGDHEAFKALCEGEGQDFRTHVAQLQSDVPSFRPAPDNKLFGVTIDEGNPNKAKIQCQVLKAYAEHGDNAEKMLDSLLAVKDGAKEDEASFDKALKELGEEMMGDLAANGAFKDDISIDHLKVNFDQCLNDARPAIIQFDLNKFQQLINVLKELDDTI